MLLNLLAILTTSPPAPAPPPGSTLGRVHVGLTPEVPSAEPATKGCAQARHPDGPQPSVNVTELSPGRRQPPPGHQSLPCARCLASQTVRPLAPGEGNGEPLAKGAGQEFGIQSVFFHFRARHTQSHFCPQTGGACDSLAKERVHGSASWACSMGGFPTGQRVRPGTTRPLPIQPPSRGPRGLQPRWGAGGRAGLATGLGQAQVHSGDGDSELSVVTVKTAGWGGTQVGPEDRRARGVEGRSQAFQNRAGKNGAGSHVRKVPQGGRPSAVPSAAPKFSVNQNETTCLPGQDSGGHGEKDHPLGLQTPGTERRGRHVSG